MVAPVLLKGKSQMKKNYGLTNTELQIMELLWAAKEPMSFRDIMDVAATEWKKSWKVQTLNTFLLGLQKMGLVGTDKSMSAYNMYYALCTKEQHIHSWRKKWQQNVMEIPLPVLWQLLSVMESCQKKKRMN